MAQFCILGQNDIQVRTKFNKSNLYCVLKPLTCINFEHLHRRKYGCPEEHSYCFLCFPCSCTAKEVLMLLSQRICQVKHHRALLWQPQCAKQISCLLIALSSYWGEGSHQQKVEWACYIQDTTSIAVQASIDALLTPLKAFFPLPRL